MPTHFSNEFLSPTSPTVTPPLHRSYSDEHTDFLADKEKWERQVRERETKNYHDSRYSSLSSPHQRSPSSDLLHVPTFNSSHRHARSYDQIIEKKGQEESERGYKLREERPRSYHDDRISTSVSPSRGSELPLRHKTAASNQRRPTIKVQIHQDDTPRSSANVTPMRSSEASSRSPSRQTQLMFLSTLLKTRLAEIGQICHPHLHIEASVPRDLTFSKIAEEVEGFALRFRIWSQVVNLEGMERIDVLKRETVELTARTLGRILERVGELINICNRATPRDLRIEPLLRIDDDDGHESYGDDDSDEGDEGDGNVEGRTESLGFVVQSHFNGINLQMQTLSRLTRSLQEATPDAKAEVIAVGDLVAEVDRFFGSPDALDRYLVNPKLTGRNALNEARYIARGSRA